MIYLFDDKKNRQLDFGWDDKRFHQFEDFIKPIYLYKEMEENNIREKMFSSNNIILFHESFFDYILNKQEKTALEIRERLNKLTKSTNDYKVVYFSGSKNSRKLEDNIGYIPVSILYQNLDVFIAKLKNGDENLNYLLFGENYKIEEFLLNKIILSNNEIEDSISNANPASQNFIALTLQNEIETVFQNAKYETFYLDENQNNEITDEYLTKIIEKWFSKQSYSNIFIPLCFGPTLSDYNGLRFALHIRCTESPNRLANIYIYSAVDYSLLVDSEYFDVLKTKNVNLIDYKKIAFQKAVSSKLVPFNNDELSNEIKKIKLDPPKNYEDNHSIANEWSIFRWANSLNISDNHIKNLVQKIGSNLYFKYLSTVHPKQQIEPIPQDDLKFSYSEKPKFLYIDDQAEIGWQSILNRILNNVNGLRYNYLDNELNSKTREEIVQLSINKIKEQYIDIVILDFRLHPDDFNEINIQNITGYVLLKEIKKLNPGIQVIVFSATNKIMTLQALLREKVDGFILKESPQNRNDNIITKASIYNIIEVFSECSKMYFLKKIHEKFKFILSRLENKFKKDENIIKEFESILAISFELLNKSREDTKYINYAYLQIFLIIEAYIFQESVFIDGNNSYVLNNGVTICVQSHFSDRIEWPIKLTNNGKYEIISNSYKTNYPPRRLDTNFKVSSILIFAKGNINSSILNWTKIYTNRNKKAAHYSKDDSSSMISIREVFELLTFIDYFINETNEKDNNLQKGLKEKSFEESLDLLKRNTTFNFQEKKNKK